jgi:hypothetical protein
LLVPKSLGTVFDREKAVFNRMKPEKALKPEAVSYKLVSLKATNNYLVATFKSNTQVRANSAFFTLLKMLRPG